MILYALKEVNNMDRYDRCMEMIHRYEQMPDFEDNEMEISAYTLCQKVKENLKDLYELRNYKEVFEEKALKIYNRVNTRYEKWTCRISHNITEGRMELKFHFRGFGPDDIQVVYKEFNQDKHNNSFCPPQLYYFDYRDNEKQESYSRLDLEILEECYEEICKYFSVLDEFVKLTLHKEGDSFFPDCDFTFPVFETEEEQAIGNKDKANFTSTISYNQFGEVTVSLSTILVDENYLKYDWYTDNRKRLDHVLWSNREMILKKISIPIWNLENSDNLLLKHIADDLKAKQKVHS